MMFPIRVGVIEDDPEIRPLLEQYLGSQPELTCVLAARSVPAFIDALPRPDPQVVLLDVGLPGISGPDALPRLVARLPDTGFLLYTVFEDPDLIYRALCRGASGYILKSTPLQQIKQAIIDVVHGRTRLSCPVARRILAHFQSGANSPADPLTSAERQLLEGIVGGLTDQHLTRRVERGAEPSPFLTRSVLRKLRLPGATP